MRRRRGSTHCLLFEGLQGGLNMRGVDLLTLPVELALFFNSLRFQHLYSSTCLCFFLNMLAVLSAVRCGRSLMRSIHPTLGRRLPDTDSSMQKLRTVGFANQLTLQKELDHRNIALVEVKSNFSASQPIKQSWTHVTPSQKRPSPRLYGVMACGWILAVHRLHEQELQVIR